MIKFSEPTLPSESPCSPSLTNEQTDFDYCCYASTKTLVQYFDTQKHTQKKRFSDFVLLPLPINFFDDSDESVPPYYLDHDATDLITFGKTTINMLQNDKSKKVFPCTIVPLKANQLSSLSTLIQSRLRNSTLDACKNIILNEKQFIPSFNIAGHGSPTGIGLSRNDIQLDPKLYAETVAQLFESYDLGCLKERPIHFTFHTCNGAYAKVNPKMERDEILNKIREESFIGLFYNAMCNLGYTKISVSGYRGYYCAMATKGAMQPIVQDSYHSPTMMLSAASARYTISSKGCTTQALSSAQLCFPVLPYDRQNPTILTTTEPTLVQEKTYEENGDEDENNNSQVSLLSSRVARLSM